MMLSLYLSILPLVPLASALVYTSPAQIIGSTTYDFIVVGGGTAGSVLARRLSEDTAIRVLVIEDGGIPDDVPQSSVPFQASALRNSVMDWNFTTVPQAALNNRVVWFARGHALGGSSGTNIMAYNRGSDDVYNNWAKLTGDNRWQWANLKQYHRKTVKLTPSADGHDTTGQVDTGAYGSGAVGVSLPGFKTPIDDTVINTAKSMAGTRFGFRQDFGMGVSTGIGYLPATISTSKRSSAFRSYIQPVLTRPNLDILINTRATKLVKGARTVTGLTEFRTLEVAQSESGPTFTFKASKEIVLSGGVVGTPQLLLLSGIGPQVDLANVGITQVIDLPDVGRNLTDHPLVPAYYYFNNSIPTFDPIIMEPPVAAVELARYRADGTGRFVVPPANTFGFLRHPTNAPILSKYPDPSNGPGSGHMELMFINGFLALSTLPHPPAGQGYFTVLNAVVSSAGRGTLTLASNSAWTKPLINPRLLEHEFDRATMVQALKDHKSFVSQPSFAAFELQPYGPLAGAETDEQLLNYALSTCVTINHPVGTAKMSPKGSTTGVVDPDLLVKKTLGLRAVDASIFPSIPEVHTQGAVYIVAEHAAAMIKEKYALRANAAFL